MTGPVQDVTGRDDFGVAAGWYSVDGTATPADPAARAELRDALAGSEHPSGPPPGPPRWFVRPGEEHHVWSPGVVLLEYGGEVEVPHQLPPDLPLGAHVLRSGGVDTDLFVVPHRCTSVRERLGGRCWGWAVQVPAARSAHSWGHGDLADLAELGRWTREAGGSVLAHSPLGASVPLPSQEPSPYYASSRRFWSPLHLRVEEVEGASGGGDELVEVLARASAAGRELLEDRRIDRDRVWELKSAALCAIWDHVRESPETRGELRDVAHDETLTTFATFCALAEHHGSGWSAWPEEHRQPSAAAVARFASERAADVDRWRWIQVQLDRQLAAAAAELPLMADLPVGFDPDGADAWADQDLLAAGCRIGAPPDDFNPRGQDWGLPPYVPWRLRHRAFAPWRDTLRRVLRHAAALRVDHVMGLFRQFLIPPGRDPTGGAYVYQPDVGLLDVACMEAARAGAVLVGEDLGTVEPGVREAMAERGVLGYRVAWFADDPPRSWPRDTVAMIGTHDLPTVAGLLGGQDAQAREAAGMEPDPRGDESMARRLLELTSSSEGGRPEAASGAREVSLAAHDALARSGSDLVVATLEDAVGQVERPNLPGTVDEHPNWRLALPVGIEHLDDAGAGELAGVLSEVRPPPFS